MGFNFLAKLADWLLRRVSPTLGRPMALGLDSTLAMDESVSR